MSVQQKISVGILTVSTSCYYNAREDKSGELIEKICKKQGYNVVKRVVVPDKKGMIKRKLKYFCDALNVNIVWTTGGTGFGPYDLTPEATESVCSRLAVGLSELIRIEGIKKNKRAALSRGIAGLRKNSLIINLPGSPKAVKESLDAVIELIPHIVDIMAGKGH